jgi:hypothetical protein
MNYSISEILSNPFAYWPNYEPPRLPIIAQELLSPITNYDNMVISKWHTDQHNPEYNSAAHNTLINTFLFYRDKYGMREMLMEDAE